MSAVARPGRRRTVPHDPGKRHIPGRSGCGVAHREALARFGADPYEMAPGDVAARVSASVVRVQMLFALDRLLLRSRLDDVDSVPAEERTEIAF